MNKLKFGIRRAFGRNNGLISSYHRERGHKKLYRIVDFKRHLRGIEGKILFIEKDPFRSALIAGVYYVNGFLSYILHAEGQKIGDIVITEKATLLKSGVHCQLKNVAAGNKVHNLEYYPGLGGKISRSAGTFSKVIKLYDSKTLLKLPSGEYRLFSNNCFCSIGVVGNKEHKEITIAKAGRSRWLGKRPIVRGRAMNPVDHPHGGRTNGGIFPKTPWGLLAHGKKTVKNKNKNLIVRRRKK